MVAGSNWGGFTFSAMVLRYVFQGRDAVGRSRRIARIIAAGVRPAWCFRLDSVPVTMPAAALPGGPLLVVAGTTPPGQACIAHRAPS